MIRQASNLRVYAACLLGILFMLAGFSGAARADKVIEISPDILVIDLAKTGTRVASQRQNLALEVPGDAEGQVRVLELHGQGAGPDFNWTVYAIKNIGPDARNLVLSAEQQGFADSGFWPLRPFGPQVTNVQWTPDAQPLDWQRTAGDDNLSFRLAPGASMSIALEGAPSYRSVRVVDEAVQIRHQTSITFLRGAALAVTLMVALSMIVAYGFRTRGAFLTGGLIALASLNFMALDSGYYSSLGVRAVEAGFSLQHMRGCAEAFLACAGALAPWQLTSIKQRSWSQNLPFVLIMLAALLCFVLSFVNPGLAATLARCLLLIEVAAGFILSLWHRGKPGQAFEHSILFWAALSVWALLAAYAATNLESAKLLHVFLVTGLAVVNVVLGMVLVRTAFAEGFLSTPLMGDAGRRSLALTGALHYLWDWQPMERKLDVAPELPRSLGYDQQRFSGMSATRMIESILHPDDLANYRQALDPSGMRAGQFFERELRLIDVKGDYHWFDLRARGLPGHGKIPGRIIGTLTEITRQKIAEDRLISEAVRDPVTGLPSRALFLDRLERAIGKPLAPPLRIMMVGIERFKIVNEGLGHDLGDQILLVAGQRISDCLTKDETVARVTGSQFSIMCLENIDSRDAFSLADQIVASLATAIPILNSEVSLSVSIGISRLSSEGFSSSELQKQAASALNEAQNRGPKTILEYDVSIKDERADRLALENDLRRAIDRREIEVHYQPIVDLETREIAGFEALARWRHPKRGMLPPSDYIGLAEQAGLINQIGDQILAEAARQMGVWQRVLTRQRPIFVSINLSSEQLSETSLLDKIAVIIAREGLAPHSLKIELTESVVMRFPERTRVLVERLRSLGVGVACDDFGTGFSNLASLRDLQFDTLKMDRSFIADGALDARGGVILASVINLANSLGMRVVAEGIENDEQVARLLSYGCNLGQGYFLGEPVPARDVHALLAVFPAVAELQEPEYSDAPMPGAAPMAPRFAIAKRGYYDEPEELPSIFAVGNKQPKPVKKAKKSVAKPKRKTKAKKARRR